MGNGKEGSDNAVGLFWPNHFRQLTVAERCEGNGHFGDLQRRLNIFAGNIDYVSSRTLKKGE